MVLPTKKALEKAIDDSLLKGKQVAYKDAGEMRQSSSPKKTTQFSSQNAKQKEAARDDGDEDDFYFSYFHCQDSYSTVRVQPKTKISNQSK